MSLISSNMQTSSPKAKQWWKNAPSWSVILVFLVFVALGLRALFFWFSIHHLPATSDEANLFLMAEEISQGNFILSFFGLPYGFPVESYLMAPFVHWLPHNALGVRYQTFLLGLISVGIYLLIAKRAFAPPYRWPATLLVLFPSAYWLMTQSAYAAPLYPAMWTLAAIIIYLSVISRTTGHKNSVIFLAGLFSGLAFSNQMLSISVIAGAFILTITGCSFLDTLKRIFIFAVGAVIGLIPFILAKLGNEDILALVASHHSMSQFADRLWNLTLAEVLPGTMGISPVLFPDFPTWLEWPHLLKTIAAAFFLILLSVVTMYRASAHIKMIMKQKWPEPDLADLCIITSIAAVTLFTISTKAVSLNYRYLLPVVWVLPYLLSYAYSIFKGAWHRLAGALIICIALLNSATAVVMIGKWSQPKFIAATADTIPLDNLLDALRDDGIQLCYATRWLSPRITFESHGEIQCSTPYNEVYFGYPHSYQERLDNQPDIAYVLTDTISAKLSASSLKAWIRPYSATYKKRWVKPFMIFSDFHHPDSEFEHNLDSNHFELSSSHNSSAITALKDQNTSTIWSTETTQKKGIWIQASFKKAKPVQRVSLYYHHNYVNAPKALRITGRLDKQWFDINNNLPAHINRMRFINQVPRFGDVQQTIRFKPVELDAIRIEILKPARDEPWSLAGLEIGIQVKNTLGNLPEM